MGTFLFGLPLNLALPVLAASSLVAWIFRRQIRHWAERRRSKIAFQHFSSLHLLTNTIFASADPQHWVEDTLERILHSVGAVDGCALLQTSIPDEINFCGSKGLSSDALARLSSDLWCAYLASWAGRWGNLMVFPGLRARGLLDVWQRDPLFREFRDVFLAEGVSALAILGLEAKEKTCGTLLVGRRSPGTFQPDELRLLLAISRQIGMALEIRRLHASAERRSERLRILERIGGALRKTPDLETQLQILRRELKVPLGVTNFSLAFQEAPGGRLETVFAFDNGASQGSRAKPNGDELSECVLRTDAPLMIAQDFLSSVRRLGIGSTNPQTRTWCGVPIHFSDGTRGVLAVQDFRREHALDEKQFELLQLVAGEVAAAIENARLFERERRRVRQLALLNELGRKASTILNPKELMVTLCPQICEAFGYNFARFEAVDPERDELVVEAEAGYRSDILGRRVKIGRGLSGVAAETGAPVLANAVEKDERYIGLRADIRSALSLALRYEGETLGVLTIESWRAQHFSEEDVLTLRSLADQLAMAVHNARAFHRAQEQAVVESLTGLKTHRYFMEALDTEWRRATRLGRPFSVIMADLDAFKRVKDRRGHLESDKVLTAVGRILKANLRQFNVIARCESDEFAILAPEATTEQAKSLAERLRWSLAQDPYLASLGITASFGVATYPVHGVTPEEILRVADAGLHLAKHEEGDRVGVVRPSAKTASTEWERQLLEAYFGVTVKRMFSTGPEAFEKYFQRLEGATQEVGRESPSLMDTVTTLAFTIDAKDRSTQGHSQSVSRLAAQIANEIGLVDAEVEEIRLAGILHDIGKIGVPESVLNKPLRLTDEEFQIMKGHAALGDKILEPLKVKTIERIRPMVRHHHEAYDGGGYPDGLKGEEIPLGARILSVADAFDTIVSERTYKKGRSVEEAVRELRQCGGSQFDSALVEAFVRSLAGVGDPRKRMESLQAAN